MFVVLHSDINSLKSGLLHLTGKHYCKKSRSAKVKDGIIKLNCSEQFHWPIQLIQFWATTCQNHRILYSSQYSPLEHSTIHPKVESLYKASGNIVAQRYKTFYVSNLQIFVKSWSVCPFPAEPNISARILSKSEAPYRYFYAGKPQSYQQILDQARKTRISTLA